MGNFKKFALLSLFIFITAILSACGSSGGGGNNNSTVFWGYSNNNGNPQNNNTNNEPTTVNNRKFITLSKNAFTLEIGKTENIIVYLDGEDKTSEAIFDLVNETEKKSTIATVENGIITALKAGSATFKVSYQDVESANYFTVTVNDPTLPNLEVSKSEIDFEINGDEEKTENITVTLKGEDVTEKATFTSSDKSIVVVDQEGNITPVSEGTTTIIVHVDGANDVQIKITVYDLYLHSIVTNFDKLTIYLGKNTNIAVSVAGQDKTTDGATYQSDNTSIATVDNQGLITAVSEGTTKITVHVDNTKEDKIINVTVKKYDLTLSKSDFVLNYLQTLDTKEDINITNNDQDDVTSNATYESGNTSIVTVDDNGNITAGTTPGTTTITVHIEGSNDTTFTVTVTDSSTEVALNDAVINQLHALRKIGYDASHKSSLTEIEIPLYYRYNDNTYKITSIGARALSGCSRLTEIIIPSHITSIGEYAFNNCSSITSIEIPNNITKIESGTFYGCSSLEEIQIPNNVNNIGSYAFAYTGITNITLPENITKIEQGTFYYCEQLTFTIPENITYIGEKAFYQVENATLPDNLDITISNDSFEYTQNLTYNCNTYNGPWGASGVTIPNGITKIKDSAFKNEENSHNSYNLKNVTLPDGITNIGKQAFYYCSNLENINIPEGVITIGEQAFYECYELENITLPNTLTTIGKEAFSNCSSLTEITIPDSVTSIAYKTFYYCYDLQNVTIGNSVKSIGDYAFYNCSLSDNITIGSGVKSIGEYAFSESSLQSISIPDNVTKLGDCAFYYCSSLQNVSLGSGIKRIGYQTFYNCYDLESVYSSANSIGGSAFYYCSNLSYISTSSLSKIGESAFSDCSSLGSPLSASQIDGYAFAYCTGFTSISISSGISYDHSVFYGCTNVTDVYFNGGKCYSIFGSESPTNITVSGYGKICDYAFSGANYLESVTIEDGITEIGEHAFSDCDYLTEITFSNSVTSIGNNAFEYCDYLTEITIPDNVTSIGSYAFYYCSSLENVSLGSGITSIGRYTFDECYSLTNLTISDSVICIYPKSFYDCPITTLTTKTGTEIEIPDEGFSTVNNVTFINAKSNNSDNITTIDIPNGVTEIPEEAFRYYSNLTHVTIPNSVTTIGREAFYDCGNSSLTLDIPNSVTSIGEYAFYNAKFRYTGSASGSPWGGTKVN